MAPYLPIGVLTCIVTYPSSADEMISGTRRGIMEQREENNMRMMMNFPSPNFCRNCKLLTYVMVHRYSVLLYECKLWQMTIELSLKRMKSAENVKRSLEKYAESGNILSSHKMCKTIHSSKFIGRNTPHIPPTLFGGGIHPPLGWPPSLFVGSVVHVVSQVI